MKLFRISIILASMVLPGPLWGAGSPMVFKVPPALEPWKAWVLYGEEDRLCPTPYNDPETHICMWPTVLDLELGQDEGTFTQQWFVFRKTWLPVPGGQDIWPQSVELDGREVPVLSKKGIPSIRSGPGQHLVKGVFVWEELPEMIPVPKATGLVSLSLNQVPKDSILLDQKGRLWLRKRKAKKVEKSELRVRVFRLLNDSIPMRLTTLYRVDISGPPREIQLEGAVLQGFFPMSIESELPARLDEAHRLLVQVRPGQWEFRVTARSLGPVHDLTPGKLPYGEEVWVFKPQDHLRMVKITGVSFVDPKRTSTPRDWKKYSTFLVQKGLKLTFVEIRRGAPIPGPDQLVLHRTWWLDFDGKGFTVQDRIDGTMRRQWSLAMNPPAVLGRVTIDGVDQLITAHGAKRRPGVELRKGALHLVAESRYDGPLRCLPAVGWNHDFQSVSGELNLPPGWRLLAVSGVDALPGMWFQDWTLLDLFLVLLIALATSKLWGWRLGVLALVAVGLVFHEPGAPRLVWLHFLAATALLRLLDEGWFKRLIGLWRLVSLVALLVMAVPFALQQVRWGIYPQLEHPRSSLVFPPERVQKESRPLKSGGLPGRVRSSIYFPSVEKKIPSLKERRSSAPRGNALIQTGPGLPAWKWRTYNLRWNGPVQRGQTLRLRLLSPGLNLILAFIRVLLMAALLFAMIEIRPFSRWKRSVGTLTVIFPAFLLLVLSQNANAQAKNEPVPGYPPAELLQELKTRLLQRPDCFPVCAEASRMEISISPASLHLLFQVHMATQASIPLPGSSRSWRPRQVLLDARPAKQLRRDEEGLLWIVVPEGVHMITLLGAAPPDHSVQLPLPLKPRRVLVQNEGWDVRGLDRNGRVTSGIQLIRHDSKGVQTSAPKPGFSFPPFLHIDRVLSLGLEWRVFTTVSRLTPKGSPISLYVPLLDGESVTTDGIQVEKGNAYIQMGPKVTTVKWSSTLSVKNVIRLQAPGPVPWTETWTLDPSPIWHCELSGIPVIRRQDRSGMWRPQWRPWPGEKVTIRVSRPRPLPGQVLTIEGARLRLEPGQRLDRANLTLWIRSSTGGQHTIALPRDAKLDLFKLRGKILPIEAVGGLLAIPIRPGNQQIEVQWHQDSKTPWLIKGPKVNLGGKAVNADVVFQMPKNRWILMTWGPRLGPAVLFWTYLMVLMLAAFALGQRRETPLKTRHWILLGLGLTQIHPLGSLLIAGWFFALALRAKRSASLGWLYFDLTQIFLVGWALFAVAALYLAVQKGLLGIPNMQISGNGSSSFWLHWTQDRTDPRMPRPWVLSIPLLGFRGLMLLWSLWLAHSLLKWLRWGWQCFNEGGAWRRSKESSKIKTAQA